jgi:hypothetical protein
MTSQLLGLSEGSLHFIIFGLFSEAVIVSGYLPLNGTCILISERYIGNDVEGCGRGRWRTGTPSLCKAAVPSEIRITPNTNKNFCHLTQLVSILFLS